MKLSISERIVLMDMLPKEGNITQVRILTDLRAQLGFTEQEHQQYGIRVNDGSVTWMPGKDDNKDVPIGDVARDIIRERLTAMDAAKKLTEQHITLWGKFVEGEVTPG